MDISKPSRFPGWVPTPARLFGLAWAARFAVAAGGLPEIGLYYHGGLGDDILCTAVAHELRRRGTGRIWLFSTARDLFLGNPDLAPVPGDNRMHRLARLLRIRCQEMDYPDPPPAHLITTMCALAGIRGEIALRPYVFLSEQEKRGGLRTGRRQIAIQTSSIGGRYPMRNKQWPAERFQTVADGLRDEFDLVQLGSPAEPLLDGVLDLRGKTTIRQSAAILAASHAFIGLVGGLMHLARAVDCRSVIVYGGREHPSQSGYSANENLFWDGACSPCWLRNDCDFDRKCLAAITPEAVIAASYRQAARFGQVLPVDTATI